MSQGAYWVYLMASGRNGTLYAGITNDLARRVWQHKTGAGSAFVAKYGVTTERTDLDTKAWLKHLQEELMDAAVYCEAAMSELEKSTTPKS